MTVQKKIESLLEQHGMWPDEAAEVVELVRKDPAGKVMEHRWNDDETDYPPALVGALFVVAKQKAVEWIDANKPKHFARMILAG